MTWVVRKSLRLTSCAVFLVGVTLAVSLTEAGQWRPARKRADARQPAPTQVQDQPSRVLAQTSARTEVFLYKTVLQQRTAKKASSEDRGATRDAVDDRTAATQRSSDQAQSPARSGSNQEPAAKIETEPRADSDAATEDSSQPQTRTQLEPQRSSQGSSRTQARTDSDQAPGEQQAADESSSEQKPREGTAKERKKEERDDQRAEPDRPADPLLQQVEKAIRINGSRRLDADVHSPWQIMHGVLAYGRNFQLRRGEKLISALDWIASNPRYDQLPLIEVTQRGARFHPYTRPYAFEGHRNQFLALLGSCRLPPDFQFSADGRQVTLQDMINEAKWTTTDQDELTFTLWALTPYLDPDETWTNLYGELWSFERIAREQMTESLSWTPCGGTHLLTALALARNKYLQKHGRLAGVWVEVDQFIRRYLELARYWQNSDGSFSSQHFEGPGYEADPVKRLESSGHILEFVATAVTDEELQSEWVRRGVAAVARDLIAVSHQPVPCGPLYHSVHGLVVYRERLRKLRRSGEPSRRPIEPEAKTDNETGDRVKQSDRVAATARGTKSASGTLTR